MTPGHVELDLSDRRRVLLCPDVHGMFDALREALEEMRWNPDLDALVLLGDLVDRGPSSEEALEWIDRPGVHRIVGNHDHMPGMLVRREISERDARRWGGDWYVDLPRAELIEVSERLRDAPYALTVETPGGRRIGIIHADCSNDWDEQVRRLSNHDHTYHEKAVHKALWRRDTIEEMKRQADAGTFASSVEDHRVRGVDHVFHGHTIVGKAFSHANRTWLDTGAYRGAPLCIVDADRWLARIEAMALCDQDA